MDTVRHYYRLVDAGEVAALVALFAEEATYHRPGYPPIVGRPALERFYRDERRIEHGSHRLTDVVREWPRVAVNGHFEGTLRDGRAVHVRFADFFVLDEQGLVTRRDTFFFTATV